MQDSTFVNLFIEAGESGDNNPIRSGYMGRILRCKIFVSSNSKIYTDSGADSSTDVYTMLFIARESYGIVGMGNLTPSVMDNAGDGYSNNTGQNVKPVEIIAKQLGAGDDPLNQRATVGWKMAFAISVLNSAWIRVFEHTNAFSND